MKFLILSREKAEALSNDPNLENCLFISITSYHEDLPQFVPNPAIKGIMRLDFDDVSEFDLHCMLTMDARKILDFVFAHKDEVDLIVVHCGAGISRSAAVAAALSKILNGDDMWVFENPRYCPNNHVYRSILNAHFGGYDKRDLVTKFEINRRKARDYYDYD